MDSERTCFVRTTAREVLRHPTDLPNWWIDAPYRRRWFWRELLLAPGQGWLRWSCSEVDVVEDVIDGYTLYSPYGVAPPARRLASWLGGFIAAPWRMARGRDDWPEAGRRYHPSWEEVVWSWSDAQMARDPERKQNLGMGLR